MYLGIPCQVSSNFLYSRDEPSFAGSLDSEPMLFGSGKPLFVKMSHY